VTSTRFDIIVIGAGIAGLTSALALRETGCSVAVLDRGEPGAEASWAGGGILCPLYAWRYPPAVLAVAVAGMRRYPALLASLDSGIDPERMVTGMRILDPIGADETRDSITATLSGVGIRHEWQPGTAGESLWLPEVANVRNPRLLDALLETARAQGVALFPQRAAQGVEIHSGRVDAVRTATGTLRAERVVVAAGAWSEAFIPGLRAGSLFPVRGQMLRVEPRAANGLDHIRMKDNVYLIPRVDGSVVVGSTVEHAGFDKTVDDDAQVGLHDAACRLWPALAEAAVTHRWAGLRPGSVDEHPVLGEHPEIDGLWVNTGGFRNGLAMAPATADLLAALMTGQPTALDPAPYRVERLLAS